MQELLHLTPKEDGSICEIDLFNDIGLDKAIKKLGWNIKNSNVLDKDGKQVFCGICQKPLTKEGISAFFPGSVKAVCENIGCFMLALSEYKEQ